MRVECALVLRIAVAGTHDTFAQKQRSPIRIDVGQTNHPVGIVTTRGGEQPRTDGADDLDVCGQFRCVIDQDIAAAG